MSQEYLTMSSQIRGDVPVSAAREGEGVGSRAHVDAGHGQQSRPAARESRQDGGGGGRGDGPVGATRVRECSGSGLSEDATNRLPDLNALGLDRLDIRLGGSFPELVVKSAGPKSESRFRKPSTIQRQY